MLGYCQFIHQYVKNHDVDKLLFLSRDGDVIKKVYEVLYPQERSLCEYAYWSRTVTTKLMGKWDRYDYLRRFIDHKVNQKITLEEVYRSMGLEDMLDGNEKVILTDKNAKAIKEQLIANWHNPWKNYNLLVELLLSSKEGSLKDIVLDDSKKEGYGFVFKKPDVESKKVEQIQQGILDFVRDYCAYVPARVRESHVISGSDAYAVLKVLLQSEADTQMEMGI